MGTKLLRCCWKGSGKEIGTCALFSHFSHFLVFLTSIHAIGSLSASRLFAEHQVLSLTIRNPNSYSEMLSLTMSYCAWAKDWSHWSEMKNQDVVKYALCLWIVDFKMPVLLDSVWSSSKFKTHIKLLQLCPRSAKCQGVMKLGFKCLIMLKIQLHFNPVLTCHIRLCENVNFSLFKRFRICTCVFKSLCIIKINCFTTLTTPALTPHLAAVASMLWEKCLLTTWVSFTVLHPSPQYVPIVQRFYIHNV